MERPVKLLSDRVDKDGIPGFGKLIYAFGGIPRNSLIRASLFILRQIFFDQLLVRFHRMPGVAPEMKAEGADSTEHGHDNEHQGPDRDGEVLHICRRGTANVGIISEAGGAAEALRQRRAK